MRRALAAAAATVLTATGVVAQAPTAQAATCSTWVSTYPGAFGVTIYRGHLICFGSFTGTQYRLKMMCRVGFADQGNYTYGKWKPEGSGLDSRNSCSWPWQTTKADLHVQKR